MTTMKTSQEGIFFPVLEAFLVDEKCPPNPPTNKFKPQFLEIVTVSLQNKRGFHICD